MLSVLIPSFDYDVQPLVFELHKQLIECKIAFEIKIADDGSKSEKNQQNQSVNSLKNCYFLENEANFGRAKNRNQLAANAHFDWLLFIDCDMRIILDDFVLNYLKAIDETNCDAFFGGITYEIDRKSVV